MDFKRIPHTRIWSTVAGLTCFLQAGQAAAAGFALRNQSASGLGTSLASDTVNTFDASGIFANPAVMGDFTGQHFSLGLTYAAANIEAKNAVLTNTNATVGPVPNPNQGKTSVSGISDPAVIPSLYGVHQVNDQVRIGWGVTIPWATNTEYDETWTGRYYATKTNLTVTEITLAGSYKLNEMFDLGLGFNYQMAKGKLDSAVDLGLIAYSQNPTVANGANIGSIDALSKFEAESTAIGFQFGVLAKPTPELKVGFSYRSQVKHEAEGDLKFEGTNAVATGTLAAIGAINPALANSDDAKLDLTLPAVVSLGAAYTLDAFTYYGNITHTGWKTFEAFDVKYNNTVSTTKLDWKDSLYFALGADYRLDPTLTLRAGLSHDQGVTTDETRTPRTPDNDRTGLTLGVGYQVASNVKINAAYQKLFLDDTKVDLSDQDYPSAATRGNLKADYEIDPNIFMTSVDVLF